MTVRVERTFELAASPERVWEFIADPGKRASAISVVDDWEHDGEETIWHLDLPIPLIRKAFSVRTHDVVREEPERVEFVGRSNVMQVRGWHVLEAANGGTRLTNRFVVDGRVPGVEPFFERNLDRELDNLRTALEQALED